MKRWIIYVASGLVGLALLAGAAGCAAAYIGTDTKVLHITGKDSVVVQDSNGNPKNEYRVYAVEDTFVIKDTWLHTRFDSSRLYGRLPVPVGPGSGGKGVEMTCKVTGLRIPIISKFQNILECN